MLTLVLFFFLALGASFVCSISESGFLSLSRADIAGLISKGRRKGKVLEGMKNKVDKPLAAILTLNTVANMVGAAGVGAAANTIWGARGTAVASGVLTVLILVFGEIIPKTLGSRYAVRLADLTAFAVQSMLVVTYPVVIVLQQISRLLGTAPETRTTREEIAGFALVGHTDGALEAEEAGAISRIVDAIQTPLSEIMIPWGAVVKFPDELTVKELVKKHEPFDHERMPIFNVETGEPVASVHRKDIYRELRYGDPNRTLSEIARPLLRFPKTQTMNVDIGSSGLVALEDKDGTVVGIATLRDAYDWVFTEP